MASIIKAADRDRGVSRAAFNFDDMASHADAYVKQVRQEAAQIVAAAQAQAEKIRKQAEIDGLKAADRTMQAKVEAETARRMEAVLPALKAAAEEVRTAKQAWIAHWEQTAVHLASRIAERIVRCELAARPELPLVLVRESLELAAGGEVTRVLLNPTDLQILGPQVELVVRELTRGGAAEVQADPRIAPGGCRVETQHGVIDQQIETQLARLEEELGRN